MFSYSNGASTEHYHLHFLALFQSMAREARRREIIVDDSLFANVSNFRRSKYALQNSSLGTDILCCLGCRLQRGRARRVHQSICRLLAA